MAILSSIGRKNPRVRALVAGIYVVLILGAVTMIYPFLIMLSGSTKSSVDLKNFDAIPRFLFDDVTLYRKHAEGLFNESVELLNTAYDTDFSSFETVLPPDKPDHGLLMEWQEFLQKQPLPDYVFGCGYLHTPLSRTIPSALRAFRDSLKDQYGKDIEDVNQALGSDFDSWNSFFVLPENFLMRINKPSGRPFARTFAKFKSHQPASMLYYFSAEGFYKRMFLKPQYTRSIKEYNRLHGTHYLSYRSIHLPRTLPQGTPKEREDWEYFVRHTLNLLWIRVDPQARPIYHRFLKAKYIDIERMNRNYQTAYKSFAQVPLIKEIPSGGVALSDWESIIAGWRDPDTQALHIIPADLLRIHSVDFMFRDFLQAKYKTIQQLNETRGTHFADFEEILPPQYEAHYQGFLAQRSTLRREFLTRNYRAVLDYMVFHGRGVYNTVVYCALAVLFALLINPLAAYAMSRYRMPSTYKILLFLMLTMAFPPMVTQIPVFLMLREFHLLNTFAALLLPGLANGYSIFLLKGFFDSLPRELYESAAIDGASEWTMFWHITMRLSTPILSVIALSAFTAAYTNFMFALLICQDEKMWTLMVWLYELQQKSGQAVMYASLIIAAIPTFIIFIFCQKIILRGIVVPVEK
jgi:ABC-type glycerol-3-phosphate transport system permease component